MKAFLDLTCPYRNGIGKAPDPRLYQKGRPRLLSPGVEAREGGDPPLASAPVSTKMRTVRTVRMLGMLFPTH